MNERMNFRERPTDIYNIYIYIYIKQSALIIIIILPVEPPSFVFASLFPSFLHCPPFRRLSKDTEILVSPPNSPLHNRFLEKGNTIDKRIQKKDLTDTCKSDRLNILPFFLDDFVPAFFLQRDQKMGVEVSRRAKS